MNIPVERIKELREASGAAVMQCRNALMEAEGNIDKALEILKKQSVLQAEKKADRTTAQGLVECYVHGGRIGAMVEVNCETDFVARTAEFRELAHNLAMQVAAMCPICVSKEQLPAGCDKPPEAACLLIQPFIKDPSRIVQDIVTETIGKTGENIRVGRFARFELGEQPPEK